MAAPTALYNFFVGTLVPFLFVLTVIVFFHELGHFLVARWNKVKVDAFSIGFGPELFGFTDKRGTRWKVSAVPLGGYVKFFGDENVASKPDASKLEGMSENEREGAFEHKAVWRRALVVAAGPIANFLLAIVIYTALFWTYDDVQVSPIVGAVVEGSAAEEAGFQVGDKIVELDGNKVKTFRDISDATSINSGADMVFTVERNGEEVSLVATPRITEQTDPFGNSYKVAMVGLRSGTGEKFITLIDLGPMEAFQKAVYQTWFTTVRTVHFIGELIMGRQDASELRGPIGIGHVTSQVATLGFGQLLSLAAIISISIGLMNLFPIPMLDGGHLLFYAIEAVRGKALSPRAMDIAFKMGLTCVLALMIFATSNDIFRLLG